MAFRASAVTTGSTSNPVGNRPTGVVDGDWLWALIVSDVQGDTIGAPSGWTQVDAINAAGPDGQSVRLYRKVASSEPSTWTWTNANARDWVLIVGAWSGRDTGATVTPVSTSVETAQTTPISLALTGVTAATGDDVVFFADLDKTVNTDTWGSTPPSGYTEREDSNNGWAYGYLATQDNVSSGATGTLTATATRSAGTGNAGFSGWVFALPQASGGSGGPVVAWLTA